MAIGTCRIPVIPEWEGREAFPEEILHSSTFKRTQDYAKKHVFVIGSGNSAAEIASRLTEYVSSVTMSVRTLPHFLPKRIFGIPIVGLGIGLRHLNCWSDTENLRPDGACAKYCWSHSTE
ncbi:NAD(P)-binding domain-containing protein [Nitrosomonas ureae]|uniref:Putative flavoprotein involved in K+ transport n=1 Tax=Nitrosomonas ureae TaxID=44577 RepID=A0A1H5SIH3_9PROT|nr:NAD(P)-binding domain-containing protein [Nitrosomonas ureae]SEF50419.1 putative flavoprotein involved in K+ transport [Nitrosomonas ureae]